MPRALLSALCLFLFSVSAAQAQQADPGPVLLGAGLWSRPAYDGDAGAQALAPIPNIRYYGPLAFVRTTMGVLEGGARVPLAEGLAVGAQLAWEGGRSREESEFLRTHNLEDLPVSLSWGVHAELDRKIGPMPLTVLLRWRQDVDAARGAQADLRLVAGVFSGGGLHAGLFAQATWADATATRYYYGLSAAQAAASGLSAYAPQGGVLFQAGGLLWSYDLAPQWVLLGSFEARRLRGDALASPLVQTSASRYASLSLAYRF